jgi:hypothetical protein
MRFGFVDPAEPAEGGFEPTSVTEMEAQREHTVSSSRSVSVSRDSSWQARIENDSGDVKLTSPRNAPHEVILSKIWRDQGNEIVRHDSRALPDNPEFLMWVGD